MELHVNSRSLHRKYTPLTLRTISVTLKLNTPDSARTCRGVRGVLQQDQRRAHELQRLDRSLQGAGPAAFQRARQRSGHRTVLHGVALHTPDQHV